MRAGAVERTRAACARRLRPVSQRSRHGAAARGFTLLEMMGVLAVLALLVVFATPAYQGSRIRASVRGAAANLYTDMQYARSEAVQRNTDVTVSFSTGSTWCYGITEGTTACDCTVAAAPPAAGACSIKRGLSTEFRGAALGSASFSGDGNSYQIDPRRGQIVDSGGNPASGSVVFTGDGGYAVTAELNVVGRVRLCSDSLPGYPSC